MTENLYEILGLQKSATEAEIKKRYRILTKKYHPDQLGILQKILKCFQSSRAYEILSDPIQRALYDNPVSIPSSKGYAVHQNPGGIG